MVAPTHPKRRRRKKAAQTFKVIVAGVNGAGKTCFIESVSQYTEWQDEQQRGWFFGRVRVDDSLILHFLEPPVSADYDFMWLRDVVMKVRATGFLVLVDSTRPATFGKFVSILYTVSNIDRYTPVVVAATKQDHPQAWKPDDIRLGLGIRDIPVLPCSVTDPHSIREVVIELLMQVHEHSASG
jgi:uncharacterized protein